VKWPGREAELLPQPNYKNAWKYYSIPRSLTGRSFIKHEENMSISLITNFIGPTLNMNFEKSYKDL